MRRLAKWIPAGLLTLAITAGLAFWQPWLPKVVVGDMKINPPVQLDPEQQYKVIVWDYEWPLPMGTSSHGDIVRRAADDFMKAHPNIQVDVVIKPWDDEVSLPDALAAGTPPDVAGLPNGARLLSKQLQVPLEHYLDKERAADMLPAARAAATAYGHLWAWPRYIDPARWAVYMPLWRESCPTPESCDNSSNLAPLTTAEWTAVLAECRTKQGGCGLAANVTDIRFLYELMAAISGKSLLNENGTLAWTETDLQAGAELLQNWVAKGFLAKDIETAARTRLGRFWSGKALALAPTTPLLWYHLWQRAGVLTAPDGSPGSTSGPGKSGRLEEAEFPISWIPVPTGEQRATVARVPGYTVFRQAEYRGDATTRAAVMVAEYLSRQVGGWEATAFFGVPAHPSAVPEWQGESRLPAPVLQSLLDTCNQFVAPPADDALIRTEERLLKDTLAPGIKAVLQGEITPEEFARRFVSLPAMAVSEAAAP